MTTYNTGNPIGSTSVKDLYDNAENLDVLVNSQTKNSHPDRLGRERLTWKGIIAAGTGDTSVAVDAASRAVDAAGRAEAAAGRAEAAEAIVDATNIKADVARAEAARDAAFVNADVYDSVAEGRAAVQDGEQFQVVSSDGTELRRYQRVSAGISPEVARYPSADGVQALVDYDSAVDVKFLPGSMSVNFSEGVITTIGNSWVYTTKGRFSVPALSVSFNPASANVYILLNRETREIISESSSAAVHQMLLARTHYLLFIINTRTKLLHGYTGPVQYIDEGPVARTNYSLLVHKGGAINFDFINNKIEITDVLWLTFEGGRVLIEPQVIDLDPNRDKSYRSLLIVNPLKGEIRVDSTAGGYSGPRSDILVGAYEERTLEFSGLFNFLVNGEPHNQNNKANKPVFGWNTENEVEVSVTDSFTDSDPVSLSDIDSSTVYSWYDDLMAQYPEYISKTTLGMDESGTLPVHMYRFKPEGVSTDGRVDTKIPKTMIIALHNERINFVYPYILLREVANNWANSEALESMRFGIEFVVIPVANPWGLDNGSRKNANQVDINRNFPVGWIPLGTIDDTFYSGPSSLSEVESQYAYEVMTTEKPDIFFDCHSYGAWNNNGRTVWQPVLNDKTHVAAMSSAMKMYAQYKKKYEWLVDVSDLVYISDSTITGGGLASKSAESVGAVGGTIEFAQSLKDEPSGEIGSNITVNFSVDYFGTLILQCLGVLVSK